MRDLQQYAVGVAMHDALDGAEGVIPDGISALVGKRVKLSIIRQELPNEWIMCRTTMEERLQVRSQAVIVPLRNFVQPRDFC
jgi:hypothetical protein